MGDEVNREKKDSNGVTATTTGTEAAGGGEEYEGIELEEEVGITTV